jgi:hypothetical protein
MATETPGAVASMRRRRTPVWVLVLSVLVGIGTVGLCLYYLGEIQSVFTLRTWDVGAPRHTLGAFAEALRSGDAAGVEALCLQPQDIEVDEEGAIVSLKMGRGAPGAPVPPEALIPGTPLEGIPVEYDLSPARRHALLIYTSASGTPASVQVTRVDGAWRIKSYSGRR